MMSGRFADPATAIDWFLDGIWAERGLSENTLRAYRSDLLALNRYFVEHGVSLVNAAEADLLEFLAWRVGTGAKPRSTARQLSTFRRFYRYLLRESAITEDPTAQIEMPKVGRRLPHSLTEADVDALLAAPEVDRPLGHRDRTMLELLYATGVRVSELVGLKLSQVNLNQGVLRIIGKGDRERLVPLGDEAQDWIRKFVLGPRAEILAGRQTEYLFPTRRGGPMTRQAFWYLIKRHAGQAGISKKLSPHTVRHAFATPPAQPWCGPASRATLAGPQRRFHHPDIHPRGPRAHEGASRQASSARLIKRLLTPAGMVSTARSPRTRLVSDFRSRIIDRHGT